MKEIIELMERFEIRNNISITLNLFSDGSSSIEEFWDQEVLNASDTIEELIEFLENTNYMKSEDGRCIKPCQICQI